MTFTPLPPIRKYSVFVSHCASDAWVARRMAEAMRGQGAEPFLAEDLEIGTDFPARIRSAVLDAAEVLVYVTPWALKRPWIWLETGVAWGQGTLIACVLHGLTSDDLRARVEFPIAMLSINFVDINDFASIYQPQLGRRIEKAI
jgi:hypothetical protein